MLSWDSLKIILPVIAYSFTLFTVIRVIMDSRNPSKALSYILLAILLPVIGPIVYFSFGVNYRKNRMYNKKLIKNDQLRKRLHTYIIHSTNQILELNQRRLGRQQDMVKLLLNDSLEPLSSNQIKLLINGEMKFTSVMEALENAQKFIHIEYYIYEDDVIGNQIRAVLVRKAMQGVKVRFAYDDFGSSDLKNKFFKPMQEAGVECYPFFKVYLPVMASRANYRNHRKIIVVDGGIGFVGGINVSDRYINNGMNKLYWRDTHVRIEGPAVLSLNYHFLADWNFCSGQEIEPDENLFPPLALLPKGNSFAQIIASGPDYPRATMMLCYFTAIVNAKERVFITSPYFIPNNSINDALKKAALSGKDVRLLVPYISDSSLVNAASRSYYKELLECGVRIFLYKKGFVHAKTIAVDDQLAIISTANMDFRSFEFNFEIGTVVYDEAVCSELVAVFLDDICNSEELILELWRKRNRWSRFVEKAARLFSPLL